jgi:hypothetical protein
MLLQTRLWTRYSHEYSGLKRVDSTWLHQTPKLSRQQIPCSLLQLLTVMKFLLSATLSGSTTPSRAP